MKEKQSQQLERLSRNAQANKHQLEASPHSCHTECRLHSMRQVTHKPAVTSPQPTSPYLALSLRSPCQQPNRWCTMRPREVATMKLLPTHIVCARHLQKTPGQAPFVSQSKLPAAKWGVCNSRCPEHEPHELSELAVTRRSHSTAAGLRAACHAELLPLRQVINALTP